MGQVHHGSATTTAAVRRAIQHSQESLRALAKRYGINPKTVAKWKKRTSTGDRKTGPSDPKSTVLSIEDEAVVVAFRKHTVLPLDDCLYALQPTIPHLTRSSLHRCFQRHGISRLPDVEGDKPRKKKFKSYPIGYFHIDIAEVQTAEGKLYLFVAIDRTSKFAFARLFPKAGKVIAAEFLRDLIAASACGTPEAPRSTLRLPPQRALARRGPWPAPPMTQGKIERWHQTLKNRILLEHYYLPGDLEAEIATFIDHYNTRRYHESLNNLVPADVYTGRGDAIRLERERIKRQTLLHRRLQHIQHAA